MRCVLLAVLTVAAASEAVEALPLYKQAGAPIPSRVADLLARMTPLELAGQLQNKNEGGWDQIPNITAQFGTTGIGSLFLDEVLNRTWGHYPLSTPLDTLRARNALQSAFLASTRLSIPISFCEELLHSKSHSAVSLASILLLIDQPLCCSRRMGWYAFSRPTCPRPDI